MFLPYFAVPFNPEKEATKTRIIFDASPSQDDIGFNNIIHQRPKLQRNLVNVTLRLYTYIAAISSVMSHFLIVLITVWIITSWIHTQDLGTRI